MTCLRRPRTTGPGKTKGTLTIDFEEIDSIIHEVMAGITDGNSEDLIKTVQEFKAKYGCYMHKAQPHKIGEINFEDFRDLCLRGGTQPLG